MARRVVTAREQVATLAPWRTAPVRTATVAQKIASWHLAEFDPMEMTQRLKQEFDDWAGPSGSKAGIGPWPKNLVKHWPYVEKFMKENYPAAHQGHDQGLEEAGPALDAGNYETGPEAVAKHGYDPAETAAAMLLLHRSGSPSSDTGGLNHQRLVDIYNKRQQMQRSYDQRQQSPPPQQQSPEPDPYASNPQFRGRPGIRPLKKSKQGKTATVEFPEHGHQIPNAPGPHPDRYWGEGGCGAMALAFKSMWPDLKVGMDVDDRDGTVNHAWVHDGKRSHDFMGTHDHPSAPSGGWQGATTHMDADPSHLADLMGINWSEDAPFDDHTVHEAATEINKHWLGDTSYDDDDHHYARRRTAEHDYRMDHTAPGPEDGFPLHNMAGSEALGGVPDDWHTHPQYYSYGEVSPRETKSVQQMYQRTNGNPHEMVDIYRALPHGKDDFHTGDWVTPSLEYARQHAMHPDDPSQDMPVIKSTVPAKHLFHNGDSYYEMGYHGPSHKGQVV